MIARMRTPWAVFALLALGSHALAQDEVRATGTYYAVVGHGCDEAVLKRALPVVEAVWPLVADTFGVPDAKPEQPLLVHLYRTVDGYRAADQQLTNGKFRRNLAMSHHETRSAHVALQPPCTDETLRALGLPRLTVAMLAWEATHVARYELCPNYRDHPDWFCDGLASSVAARVLAAPPEALPFCSNDMVRTQRLLAEEKLPPVKAFLADAVADLDLGDRYAARAVLYAFLASEPNRKKLATVAGAIRRTGGGDGYAAKVLEEATAAFGREDAAFSAYVTALHPEWEEVYRSFWPEGAAWTQIAFPDSNAIAWRQEPVASDGFEAKGSLRILPGGKQQLNFLFARTDDGFYSVAFVAATGFTLFDYRSATDTWVRIGDGTAPGLRLGVSTDFGVEGRGTKLRVALSGLTWDFDLPRPLPAKIVWGLGAQAAPDATTGSAGIWQRVTVAPRK